MKTSPTLAAASLNVVLVLLDPHAFRFREASRLADYQVTIPSPPGGKLAAGRPQLSAFPAAETRGGFAGSPLREAFGAYPSLGE